MRAAASASTAAAASVRVGMWLAAGCSLKPQASMNTNPFALRPNRRRRLPDGGPARPAHWFSFVGAGALVAVGYIDPGNWATALGARREIRLPVAQRRAAVEPDGDAAAMGVVAAGRRDRARSRAALPRAHQPARHPVPLADQRDRDHRVRRRRGGRQRRRAAIAARRLADGRRADVGGRAPSRCSRSSRKAAASSKR